MDHQLKTIHPEAIPAAIERAQRYRWMNEPENAESICLDVVAIEPENQAALVVLLLALTDQLASGLPSMLEAARQVVPRLDSSYERAYYGGLICERQAKVQLRQRGRRAGHVAYEWFGLALEHYEDAIAKAEPGNDEAILRFNTCLRVIERSPHCEPDDHVHEEMGLE